MADTADSSEAAPSTDRSTIKFPYGDLDDAIEVATTLHNHFGLSASVDQIAAAMGQSLSGAFRQKMATAGTFGVVETGRGEVHLTDLGQRIADPSSGPAARVEAFLFVPLYSAIFERFRGSRLPQNSGLEAELVRLGVVPRAAAKARQTLQRAAEQAGFFSHGKDRLVQPAVSSVAGVPPVEAPPAPAGSAQALPAAPTGAGLTQHPLLVGLWQELPDPKKDKLTPEQQADWIETAKLVLKLLYSGDKAKLGVGLTYGQESGE